MLKVNEIYYSIQGESSFSGYACIFIRLTGCNLRCQWCDSEASFYDGKEMTIEQIMHKIKQLAPQCKLVEITGGEPLLQKQCSLLAKTLLENSYQVLLETSGSLDIDLIPSQVHKIVDFKCPDSKMEDKNDYSNIKKLSRLDEVKFVLHTERDFIWACELIKKHKLDKKGIPLIISSTDNLSKREICEWIKQSSLPLKFQLQMHKIIWGSNSKQI